MNSSNNETIDSFIFIIIILVLAFALYIGAHYSGNKEFRRQLFKAVGANAYIEIRGEKDYLTFLSQNPDILIAITTNLDNPTSH